jgi:predicted Rossmann fold nucleotide-binding protein DprA/Smf involved in DNA uptake
VYSLKKESIVSDNDGKINFLTVDAPVFSEPARQFFTETRTAAIAAIGNLDILQNKKLAFFCSVKCPGEIILQAYDLAQTLRDAGITVVSGFHSPMEKEVFNILSRSPHPFIACPARSIEGMRLPMEYKKLLADRRLLLLSPFNKKIRRSTVETSALRNQFVAEVAERIFVAYTSPDSKTELLCKNILKSGKEVFTLANENNKKLIDLRAIPVEANNIKSFLT